MRTTRTWSALAMLVLGVGLSKDVGALANRVFVSAKSGNDANTCDNINAPCQTFAGAVTKLNPGGEAIVLDSGGYGSVTINQAVTIEAPPGVLAFVHPSSGDGITIAVGSGTVVLRGIVLNGGAGNGIQVNLANVLHIENCVISGFNHGIEYSGGSGQFFVKDTIVRNNAFDGIFIDSSAGTPSVSIDHCRLEGNAAGNGFEIHRGSATVRDSVASGNNSGFSASGGAANLDLNIESCLVANNTASGIASANATATVRVSGTTITGNGTGVLTFSGGVMLSRGNNTVEGNTSNGTFTGSYTPK